MFYTRVLVADPSFHGKEALTYTNETPLVSGQLVTVPLKDKVVAGVVIDTVKTKPRFAVKPVTAVLDLPPLPAEIFKLMEWMPTYYPAPLGSIAQLFFPGAFGRTAAKNTQAAVPSSKYTTAKPPTLTEGQNKVLQQIHSAGLHLLHGETGSGKTRVYIELARKARDRGKSSIILTPEIGLTSQLAQNFCETFGEENVITLHSRVTPAARRELWRHVLKSETPLIVVGARSALFAPVAKLGLIVIDESHETSYKQDSVPHYQTSVVAAKLAALHKATLVLGSATPSVSDYFIATAKNRPVLYLGEPAIKHSPVTVTVVDRRDKQNFSKSMQLSDAMLAGVRTALGKKEQSLVFLNRRGTARVVMCEACGWQALCPHCDLPLTYHADSHAVVCHSCALREPTPINCPSCQNPSILFKSVGTKAITDQLGRLFPNAVIQRFDTDNTKAERLEAHFSDLQAGKTDILVGTQTLAKGLDLPRLSFVGVVDAETSLSFPDFSATERSYQLIAQVLGRIGRGHRPAEAVIQTFSPNNVVIRSAINKDWKAFYEKELGERKLFNFPPFCFVLKITCRRKSAQAARNAAQRLCDVLHGEQLPVSIEGPAPSFYEKQRGYFQWQIVVKSRSRDALLAVVAQLPSGTSFDIDPVNLL